MTVKFLLETLEERFFELKALGKEKYKKEILNNVIFASAPCCSICNAEDEDYFPCISVEDVTINSDLLNKNYLWVENFLKKEGPNPNIVVLKCDFNTKSRRSDCVTLCKLIETLKGIEDKNKGVYVELWSNEYNEVINAWSYTEDLFESTSEYVKSLADNKCFMGLFI